MRTLLIDNYDSYTYNLFQALAEVNGQEPVVVTNDALDWAALSAIDFDNIVLSPGPGHPARPGDFGVCSDVLRQAEVPLLGVCLGHQGLVTAAGGVVDRAPVPMHGRLSRIWHDDELFDAVPQGFQAVRYHSLIAVEPLPTELRCVARTADGLVMAVRHRRRPHWGVQFHPESIATEHGLQLLRNLHRLTAARQAATGSRPAPARAPARSSTSPTPAQPPYGTHVRALERWFDPEHVFAALHSASETAFWLDSSRAEPGMARFSFLGAADGPLSQLVTYDVDRREVTARTAGGTQLSAETIFEYVERTLARGVLQPSLPFSFTGGFVGYLGYELKADCGGDAAHRSPHPDAALVFADRFVVFDHEERRVYLFALTDDSADDASAADAEEWFDRVHTRIVSTPPPLEPAMPEAAPDWGRAQWDTSRAGYLAAISECLDQLAAGESYEVCLTDRVRMAPLTTTTLEAYRALRRVNPAPYAAYLRLDGLDILSSSPERFLRLGSDRWIEAKPIKGTAPRAADPDVDARIAARLCQDEKSRAENLMIVDLLRNDIGRISEVGSVHVPHLMVVESYETVHQLVSTVRGRLRPELTIVDCLGAMFPGGSMTGAPKRRTMQIIDQIEGAPRGVYAGAIGFLSLNGTADLSIVIRTAVVDVGGVTIGTGGAIVAQSDLAAEYDEIVLKATAPVRALQATDGSGPAERVPVGRGGATSRTEAGR